MATTLIAALVVGLLAPVVRGFLWGVPPMLLSPAMMVTSFFGSALTVLVIGAACSVVLRATDFSPYTIDLDSGIFAGLAGVALLLNSERRMRDVRGLSVLCQRLADPDARPQALRALGRILDRARQKDLGRHAALALMATGPLTQASLWEEARTHLLSVDESALDEAQAVLRNQALATCQLQFDDTEGALDAIGKIRRPAEPSIEVWLVAMEALVEAVTGNPDAAARKLGGQDTSDNPSLKASHQLVRAHILAARGDEAGAKAELASLQQTAGRAGVERVLRPAGPASQLAKTLLAED
ncbi:MAG: hypothetical protein AAF997_23815 [Myxococcota bacterium]